LRSKSLAGTVFIGLSLARESDLCGTLLPAALDPTSLAQD